MGESEAEIFDRIMELVGNDGKFQNRFNFLFNFFVCLFVSMSYMNIVMVLNEPDHWCHVPGRELTNYSIEEWRERVLPTELDNKKKMSFSRCKMYNLTTTEILELDTHERLNISDEHHISCTNGFDYNKTWYEETVVSKEDWVCDDALYVTNTFSFNRLGEVVGTLIFGQLGDTIGRRPVFICGVFITIFGRVACLITSGTYWLFALSSISGMLTALMLFQSPLVIAMEICKGEKRAKISMIQCYGWTSGMVLMPLIFWAVRDWTPFLMFTTFPLLFGIFFPKYLIESPRWLGNKGKYDRCAKELQKIADINGTNIKVTEVMIKEMLKDHKVEKVYGMASFLTSKRLALNTSIMALCWIIVTMVYYALVINASRMDGNPFLNFIWQSAIELPGVFAGKYMGDKIGRRFTQVLAFFCAFIACIPILFLVQHPEYSTVVSLLAIIIRFMVSIIFFAVHLQAMEIYPTCLRQTGFAIMTIVANLMGLLGPYIIYLGTEFDVRYPYVILAALFALGTFGALFLPETLGQLLPETIADAHEFGKGQPFWGLPKPNIPSKRAKSEKDAKEKLNQEKFAP
ncbi:carcinine transporter-like [Culicoides brevitarsis]|uniref:carcinine transporter-like n=1 Tax=Culicoides brevitarsis TaxID=469753 RepID=UPI00307B4B3C